jgi:hypothetical protein
LFIPDAEPRILDRPSAVFTVWEPGCPTSSTTYAATSGSVDIEGVVRDRTAGSFALEFGDDALEGIFAAVACDVVVTTPDPLGEASHCE